MNAPGHKQDREAEARDAALGLLEEHRKLLIQRGRAIALKLVLQRGFVTSTMVFDEMRRVGVLDETVVPRWMGAVFRNGWKQVGTDNSGSHKRAVAVWALEDSEHAKLDYEAYKRGWEECKAFYGIR